MAIQPHMKLEFGGPLDAANVEIWSNSLKFLNPEGGVLPDEEIDGALAIIKPLLSTWFASAGALNPLSAKLQYAKLNTIGSDGRQVSDPTHEVEYSPVVTGHAAAANGCAVDTSIAISFKGTRTRGKATNGRIYPPNYGIANAVTGGGKISLTSQTSIATAIGAFFADVADATSGVPLFPVLVSSTTTDWQFVNEIRVGAVFDVQRRRRNALTEDYYTTPLILA